MRRLFPVLFLIAALLPVSLSADTVVEEIIARVNNQIITRSEFVRAEQQARQDAQQQDPANADRIYQAEDKDVLRGLIDQQLLLEKGKDLGITADTEVIKRLDAIRKQMKLETMEDLERAAATQGVSFEDFKQDIRNRIITQQVIGREVGSRLSVTSEEEHKYYDEHKSEMDHPEQIHLGELLISTAKRSDHDIRTEDQIVSEAKTKADQLLADIRKGASFEDVAKKNSDGPTAEQGGDLGYFKHGTLAKELEDITFAMKPGDVTDVIRTKQGFVILKVIEHQSAGIPPFEEVEGQVQNAIYMEKMQPALRAYLAKLREDAYIDIRQGYVDSGASANQTKPIETTAKAAKAKEMRKKKKKFLLF